MKSWKKYGFHYLDSPEGEDVFERLNYSKKELEAMKQPELPYQNYQEYLRHPTFRIIRGEVISNAGGICEVCHTLPVTEVHHLKYPKWGTFDVPENLIAVCHRCHCEIHGKEN